MKTIYIEKPSDINANLVYKARIVLGFFDGIHLGHLKLIHETKKYRKNKPIVVFTFDKSLKNSDKMLISLENRIKTFEKLDVDYLYIFKTSEEFKNLSPNQFIDLYLKPFKEPRFYAGEDFRFGRNAKGDVNTLKEAGLDVSVVSFLVDLDGNKISSRYIKKLVSDGEIEKANSFLGENYYLNGIVQHGLQNGGKVLFKTANLDINPELIVPKEGVYITKVEIGGKLYPSLTNIGNHPSLFALENSIIEVHVMNFDGDIYGDNIKVIFYKRLRDEMYFDDLNDLKYQIAADIMLAKEYFKIK